MDDAKEPKDLEKSQDFPEETFIELDDSIMPLNLQGSPELEIPEHNP